jgi:hypothetical protein
MAIEATTQLVGSYGYIDLVIYDGTSLPRLCGDSNDD